MIELYKGKARRVLCNPNISKLAKLAKFSLNVLLLDAVTDATDENSVLAFH